MQTNPAKNTNAPKNGVNKLLHRSALRWSVNRKLEHTMKILNIIVCSYCPNCKTCILESTLKPALYCTLSTRQITGNSDQCIPEWCLLDEKPSNYVNAPNPMCNSCESNRILGNLFCCGCGNDLCW